MQVRLILGDQLNSGHSWYQDGSDEEVVYCMFEMRQETDYVKHHIQKIVSFFLAMRAFANDLQESGHKVIYYMLDDERNTQDLKENLKNVIDDHNAESWSYQAPDEYRLDEMLKSIQKEVDLPCEVTDTEHFLSSRSELRDFFGEKNYVMENFYRMMRKKHNVLMEGDEPATGKWNYDHDNRKKLPKKIEIPPIKSFQRNVKEVLEMIDGQGVQYMGSLEVDDFVWPVTKKEGEELLEYFLENCLPNFGTYQDAMTERGWSLFHSRLSFLINAKILQPLDIIRAVEKEWRKGQRITIAQAEGYIRQILGWREYMRGIYWDKMPDFAKTNFFENERELPDWYWTGDTKMTCLRHAVKQSLTYGYAHHIQRLMVTGNFALLTGVHPDEVDRWYLGIYVDAIEWVEITNTRGMSQYADGGLVGTKPYVSSGSYINKMSDYCSGCVYKVKEKTTADACPLNSLYWNFLDHHRDKLESNPRMTMMYRVWDKMASERKTDILERAEYCLEHVNEL